MRIYRVTRFSDVISGENTATYTIQLQELVVPSNNPNSYLVEYGCVVHIVLALSVVLVAECSKVEMK